MHHKAKKDAVNMQKIMLTIYAWFTMTNKQST